MRRPEAPGHAARGRARGGSGDAALLRCLASRDAAAFALLYDRHARQVFGHALRLHGDPAAVEAAFLALWHRAAGADPPRGDVRGWLLATVERDETRDTMARAAAGTDGA